VLTAKVDGAIISIWKWNA